ncbi:MULTISPECIES: hypothetical protein [Prauserella salsuginis group]|uniref:Uncharacterized protein n=1 Tax=Prauserella salsuginis TaxID=387889 RepID=A0ABW6G1L6_9PSEU|nr:MULTISPECIES: hypothetical protein [Prauserella salsuginis group]
MQNLDADEQLAPGAVETLVAAMREHAFEQLTLAPAWVPPTRPER